MVKISKIGRFLKNFDLKCYKNELVGSSKYFFFEFFLQKNDVFDCKTSFLDERNLRIIKIKIQIVITLKVTSLYGDFPAF